MSKACKEVSAMSTDDIISKHTAWLDLRARHLCSIFSHLDRDDVRQDLALNLLRFESQMSAWLEVFKQAARQKDKRFIVRTFTDLVGEAWSELHLATITDNKQLKQFDLDDSIAELLNEREQVVLLMWLHGSSLRAIGTLFGRSATTINKIRKRAIRKLTKEYE